MDVAWLAMRVHVGRQRKMGVGDVIDVEEQDDPPHPLGPEAETPHPPKGTRSPPPPPSESPAYGHPGGASGAGGGAGVEGGSARVGGAAAGGGV